MLDNLPPSNDDTPTNNTELVEFDGFNLTVACNLLDNVSGAKSRTYYDLVKTLMDIWIYSEVISVCLEFPFDRSYFCGACFSHMKVGYEDRKGSGRSPYYNVNTVMKVMDEEKHTYWALIISVEEYDCFNEEGIFLPTAICVFHLRVSNVVNENNQLDVLVENFIEQAIPSKETTINYLTDLILNSTEMANQVVANMRKHSSKFTKKDTVIQVDFGKRE